MASRGSSNQAKPTRAVQNLAVGAFSLTSAEFVLPLIPVVNHHLTVLVMPPSEWEATAELVAAETPTKTYLTLPLPVSAAAVSIAALNSVDLTAKVRAWVELSVRELRESGLDMAALAAEVQGSRMLSLLSEREPQVLDFAQDVAISVLTALYASLDTQVRIEACPTSIRWPPASGNRDAVFLESLSKIASAADGTLELRGGRGSLYVADSHGVESRIVRIELDDGKLHLFGQDRRRLTITTNTNDPDFYRQEVIKIRPTGLFRTVQLACYGLPAHIPWYQLLRGKGKPVWKSGCHSHISAHLPREHRIPSTVAEPSGAYLWEYSSGSDAVSSFVERFLGKLDWRVDPSHLSWLCALPSGLRVRSRLYPAARGLVQLHYRRLLSIERPTTYRSILDLVVASVGVWSKICARKKAIVSQRGAPMSWTDVPPAPDIEQIRTVAQNIGVTFEHYRPLVDVAFDSLKEGSEHRDSSDLDMLARMARGWLEIATTIMHALFVAAGAQLQATLPILALLGTAVRPALQSKKSSIILAVKEI